MCFLTYNVASFRVMKTVYPYRHDAIQDVLEDVVSFKAADEYLFAIVRLMKHITKYVVIIL